MSTLRLAFVFFIAGFLTVAAWEHRPQSAVAAPAGADLADSYSRPDPSMTPGAIVAEEDRRFICSHPTRERRAVSAADKARALAAYNIPAARSPYYEIDHLVPLALGGANDASNLWPEPWAEADKKDELEVYLQYEVCAGRVDLGVAQHMIADDWVAAYRKSFGVEP